MIKLGQKIEILRMHFVEGKPKKQIARELKISKNTVKTYVNEFLESKKELIAKCIGGEIKAQEYEVNDIKWLDFDEAIKTITYDNTRELFKKILKERKI